MPLRVFRQNKKSKSDLKNVEPNSNLENVERNFNTFERNLYSKNVETKLGY